MQFRQMPQPLCASPATRVPTAYLAATFSDALRSSATATTSPAHSWPMTAGKVGGQKPGNLPAMILGSVPQMATALTRHRTSSPLGCGVGSSWNSKSFGPLRTSAFIVFGMPAIVSALSVDPGIRSRVDGRGETPRLLGRRPVVGQRQDLGGEPALVVDIVERRCDLREVDVAYAGRPAVAVDDVEVAEVLSGCAYRRPYRDHRGGLDRGGDTRNRFRGRHFLDLEIVRPFEDQCLHGLRDVSHSLAPLSRTRKTVSCRWSRRNAALARPPLCRQAAAGSPRRASPRSGYR